MSWIPTRRGIVHIPLFDRATWKTAESLLKMPHDSGRRWLKFTIIYNLLPSSVHVCRFFYIKFIIHRDNSARINCLWTSSASLNHSISIFSVRVSVRQGRIIFINRVNVGAEQNFLRKKKQFPFGGAKSSSTTEYKSSYKKTKELSSCGELT